MATVLVAFLLTWVGPLVVVEGPSTCPSPGEVAARLDTLLPSAPSPHEADVASIESAQGQEVGLVVRLRAPDGRLIASRELAGAYTCSDLARAAAVFIAAVAIDSHPELSGLRTPLLLDRPDPRPGDDRPAQVSASLPPWVFEVGLGAGTSFRGGAAPVATALLTFGRSGRPLGLWLSLSGEGQREAELAGGVARWTTFAAGLGGRWRRTGRWLTVDLHGEGLAGVLTVSGRGFPLTYAERGLAAGLGGGVRLSVSLARSLGVWLDAGGRRWLTSQTVFAGDEENSETIPRVSLSLLAGFSFFVGR